LVQEYFLLSARFVNWANRTNDAHIVHVDPETKMVSIIPVTSFDTSEEDENMPNSIITPFAAPTKG